MEQKIKIPNFKEDVDETMENTEPAVRTLSSSKASKNWEKISEDWVSLFLDPSILDDRSRSLPLDLESYLQSDSILPETNNHSSLQDQLADFLLLHSTNDQMSHSDMALGSSLNVLEDLFGKEDSLSQVDFIHPKNKPLEHNDSTSPASSFTHVKGSSSSRIEVDLWKDKEANPNLSIILKREMNAKVSSSFEGPTSSSTIAIGGESGFTNNASLPSNALQSSSCLLQCEEGEIGSRDVGRGTVLSSNSIAQVEILPNVSQSETFSVRHFQGIGNAIKVGLLGRSGDKGTNAQGRKNCEIELFKLQNQVVLEELQSNHSNGIKKGESGDEDDEKRQARLMRTRKNAQFSRQRKKVYVDELESKLRTMAATVVELNTTISHLSAENVNLRRQLGYYYLAPGICPRPGMAMHGMPMGSFPRMVVGRPMYLGGQMPLVPIPRIKTQTLTCDSKRPKSGAIKEEGNKMRTKLKAVGVASMAIVGLICLVMLFGSIDQAFNGSNGVDDYTSVENVQVRSPLLTSWNEGVNPLNSTKVNSWDSGPGWLPLEPGEYGPERKGVPSVHTRLAAKKLQYETEKSQGITKAGFESFIQHSIDGNATLATSTSPNYFNYVKVTLLTDNEAVPINTSQLFAAFVFVPGANGLVKVDGNVIVQAIIASDKSTKKHSEKKSKSGSKKKKRMKQFVKASSKRQAMKSFSMKALDNLTPKVSKVSKNATIGPFVTARPLLGNVNSVVKANNPISPLLRAGSLQQWMLGVLHDPRTKFFTRKLTKKEKSQFPVNNSKAVPATQDFFYSFTPYDATSRGLLTSWLFSSLSTGLVLDTTMRRELFQFNTTTNTSAGQVPSPKAKNMAKSMATKVAWGNPHNVPSTILVSVVLRSRRDLFAVPLSPMKPKPSSTEREEGHNRRDSSVKKTVQEHTHNENLCHGVLSMVVSVMAGPEEYGDSKKNETKGFSRIFVVVLIDNHKYIAYSCMLPFDGLQAHVVAE